VGGFWILGVDEFCPDAIADASTVLAESERVGLRTTRRAVGQAADALRR
jgi:hypothetical protein